MFDFSVLTKIYIITKMLENGEYTKKMKTEIVRSLVDISEPKHTQLTQARLVNYQFVFSIFLNSSKYNFSLRS